MIIHLWHHMGEQDAETHRRMQVARQSRETEYLASSPGDWLAPAMTFSRDSRTISDEQPVPFVRDMLSQGMAYAKNPEDILFITNADIGFAPRIHDVLLGAIKQPLHMRRRDFRRIDTPLQTEEIPLGHEYPGGDGFAFTVKWWKKNRRIFPDMLLGRFGWDSAMRNLIRRAGGIELKNQLWHESHAAPWSETAYDIEHNAGNRHNRALLLAWIEKYGGSTEDHLHETLTYK